MGASAGPASSPHHMPRTSEVSALQRRYEPVPAPSCPRRLPCSQLTDGPWQVGALRRIPPTGGRGYSRGPRMRPEEEPVYHLGGSGVCMLAARSQCFPSVSP